MDFLAVVQNVFGSNAVIFHVLRTNKQLPSVYCEFCSVIWDESGLERNRSSFSRSSPQPRTTNDNDNDECPDSSHRTSLSS
jgi:hypothetical protein